MHLSIYLFLVLASLTLVAAQPEPVGSATPVFLGIWDGIGVSDAYSRPVFSPGASRFAAVTKEGVKLWDVSTGTRLRTLPGSEHADALALSPNEKFLAVRDGTAVRTVSVAAGKVLSSERVPGPHTNRFLLRFSPDGTHLAASEGNRARLFRVNEDGLLTCLPLPIERVAYDVSFSPDNRFVLASSAKGVHLSRISDGSSIRYYTHSNEFTRASFGPDNSIYITGGKRAQHLSSKGRVLRTFTAKQYLYEHAVSPDRRLFATAGGSVHVWEVASGKKVATLEGEPGEVYTVMFSEDSKTLYTASDLGAVSRYALPSNTPERLFRAEDFRITLNLSATYSKKSTYEVSGTFRFGNEPPLPVSGTLPTKDVPPFSGFAPCPFHLNIGQGEDSWSTCYLQPDGSPKVAFADLTRFTLSRDEEVDLAFENRTEDEYMESYRFVLRLRE